MFIQKITSNANKSEISSTLGSDIKSLISKANEWKKMDSDSNGTFQGITTKKLSDYLPDNMVYDDSGDYIKSSGLGGQIHYQIASDKINKNGDSIKIYIDASSAISSENARKSAEVVGMNLLVKYASNHSNAIKTNTASALGDPNDDFTKDGDAKDGKFGVRRIAQ